MPGAKTTCSCRKTRDTNHFLFTGTGALANISPKTRKCDVLSGASVALAVVKDSQKLNRVVFPPDIRV